MEFSKSIKRSVHSEEAVIDKQDTEQEVIDISNNLIHDEMNNSIEHHNLKMLNSGVKPYNHAEGQDENDENGENKSSEDDNQNLDVTDDDDEKNVVDEEFYKKYCLEIELTQKLDMSVITDFVKTWQIFEKIKQIFKISDSKKAQLSSLYYQACYGDFKEGNWLMNMLFSSRTKEDDKAWKELLGTPREKAMHYWVYEVYIILNKKTPEEVIQLIVDEKIKEKPNLKMIKQLYSFCDHFLVIHRDFRHLSRSEMTESLISITKSEVEDEFDSFEYLHVVTNIMKRKRSQVPFKLLKVNPESIFFVNFGGLLQRNVIKYDELKKKICNIGNQGQRIINPNEPVEEEVAFDLNDYTVQEQQMIRKIQHIFKSKLRARVMRQKSNIREVNNMVYGTNKQQKKVQLNEDHTSSEEDNEEIELKRREQHDLLCGKMMSKYPYHFLDMRLSKPHSETLEEKLVCPNCKKQINIDQQKDELLWHSIQFGYFCKNCLHPTDSDVNQFLDQIKMSSFNFPRFEVNNRIRQDAIKIKKNRSTAIKGFCYKNRDKQLRRKIFIHKWQWRMNELRNILKEHEFLIPRPKKTQNMIDLKNRWPPKYQRGQNILTKGYRRRLNEEERSKIKENKKVNEIQRRLSGINVQRFKNVTNIAIETFQGIYESSAELKASKGVNFNLLLFKPEETDQNGNKIKIEERIKIVSFKQREFYRNLEKDKEFNPHFLPMVPVCYIRNEKKFGIINRSNGEIVKPVVIESLDSPKCIYLVPTSTVYELKSKSNRGNIIQKFKQLFSLCFFIAPKHNSQFKGQKYKNRGMLQIFEILVEWKTKDPKFNEASIKIVNQKLIMNVNTNGMDQLQQNFDKHGQICGLKIFDEISSRVLTLQTTLPHQFSFQNDITYSRYQKFYKYEKPYEKDKAQILMVETQLTEQAKFQLYPYQQIMVLNNAIKVLLNHVPYDQEEYFNYEFIESEDKVAKEFIENHNWLQPLGALGCRSMASFLYFHKDFSENIDPVILKAKQRPTLIQKFEEDQPKFFNSSAIMQILNPLRQDPDEMSFDLSCRNPIHDALDQDKLLEFRNQLEIMINFVGKSKNSSLVSREILTGIMHRVLADESNNLKAFYTSFLIDDHEDRNNFSKFAVKFKNNQFKRHSHHSHQINYYNDITTLDPEQTIISNCEILKEQAELEKMESFWKICKSQSDMLRRKKQKLNQEEQDGSENDMLSEQYSSNGSQKQLLDKEKLEEIQKQKIEMLKKKEEEAKQLAIEKQIEDENVFGTPNEKSREIKQVKKFEFEEVKQQQSGESVKQNKPYKNGTSKQNNEHEYDPHQPFTTVKNENKFEIQIKQKQRADSQIPDVSQSILLSQNMLNEDEQNLIKIEVQENEIELEFPKGKDQIVQEGGDREFQEESSDSDKNEGGDETEVNESEAESKQDSDEEDGYTVDHFTVDFRHVFLQANLQNIFGKPKHQIQTEKQHAFSESNVILKRFYETEGFQSNLETTQIISLIYTHYQQDIENILSLRLLSDSQFVSTVKMIKSIAFLYIIFMVIPFLIQIRSNNNVLVGFCLASIIVVQVFLFWVEMVQLKKLTWKVYSSDQWNLLELAQSAISIIYVIVRALQSDQYVLPQIHDENELDQAPRVQFWVIVNTLFFLLQVAKIMYFMRASISLAKIVKLTIKVFTDVSAFTLFLAFWMTIFTELYSISGISLFDPVSKEKIYPGISEWFAMWIQCFRNSIGDISIPNYVYWDENENLNQFSRGVFTHYAWILFIVHEFFILICLFNFLIAIVSQSYDNIMDAQEIETTMSKIYLNNEAAILYDVIDQFRRKVMTPSQTFHLIVSLDEYDKGSDAFQGFVRTIKLNNQKEQKITRRQVFELRVDLNKKIEQKFNKFEQMINKLDSKLNIIAKQVTGNKVETELDDQESEVSKRKSQKLKDRRKTTF